MIKVFIKNYVKNGKKTQILCVTDGVKYQHYFVGYSDKKKSVYITPTKDVTENEN